MRTWLVRIAAIVVMLLPAVAAPCAAQNDAVAGEVAAALKEYHRLFSSKQADVMAERARMAIAAMEIPLLEGDGSMRVTTSVGAASSVEGNKDDLIAAADAALYVAKREGKNRTARAEPDTANVVSGE